MTLAGFAIAPVFAGVMALQTRLVVQCEVTRRQGVLRCMFSSFSFSRWSLILLEGCTYGVASGLIYLAQALLFYVGAVLIARGLYTYLQMVEVLNLVVLDLNFWLLVRSNSYFLLFNVLTYFFSVAEKIARALQATHDLNEFLTFVLSFAAGSPSAGSQEDQLLPMAPYWPSHVVQQW